MNKKMSLSALAILFLTLSSGSVFCKSEIVKVEDANNPDEFVQLVKTTNPQVLKKVVYNLLGQFTPEEMFVTKVLLCAGLGAFSGGSLSNHNRGDLPKFDLGTGILVGFLSGAAIGAYSEILPYIFLKLSQRFGTKNRAPKLRKLLEAAQNKELFKNV